MARVLDASGEATWRAVFRQRGALVPLPLDALRGQLERAWALTVHKAGLGVRRGDPGVADRGRPHPHPRAPVHRPDPGPPRRGRGRATCRGHRRGRAARQRASGLAERLAGATP
ncbi:MAG: hypothetical protein R2939_06570 [Kofleriaceae bacterium]